MANTKVDTGHGATITFGTSSIAWNWLTIDPGERMREPVNTTYLSSTAPTYMAGDLQESGEAVLTFQFDPHGTATKYATTTTEETVTITWPIAPGGSAGATLAGTGLVTRVKFPQFQTNQLQVGEMTVKWTGTTPPAFTVGS